MSNLIQIKRSLTTPIPSSLADGELAYTANGNVLYIGSNGQIEAIAGLRTPGTLTANQALVANTTSGIDKIITANLVAYSITANGTTGSTGFVLSVDSSGNTYWQDPNLLTTAAAGSNGQIQFNGGDNDFTASDGLTFIAQSNNLTVGNTVFSEKLNIASNTFVVTNTNITILPGITLTANGVVGQPGEVLTSNSTGVYWASPVTTLDGLSDVSAALASNNNLLVYNSTTTQWENHGVGNGLTFTNHNLTINTGNGLTTNTTGLHITPRTFELTGDVSGNAVYDGTGNVSISVTIGANSVALGTDTTGDYVASITSGDGINVTSGTGEGSSPVISVVGNTGVTANSSGVFIGQPVGVTDSVTFNDIDISGNAIFGTTLADVIAFNSYVASDFIPESNVTYNLGSVEQNWNNIYSANIISHGAYITGDVSITGDLIVTGNVTSINVNSLSVSDPVIKLAVNNTISDTLWLGWTGHYNGQGNTTNHAGMARNPDDKEFYIFGTYGDEDLLVNENVINTADPTFSLANLHVYLKSGGLITNSSAVAITANSTVAVDLVANTLSLTTALPATSGGVGHTSYALGDILVASNSTYINKLSVGTAGKVLQSNGSTVVYADLDGGSF